MNINKDKARNAIYSAAGVYLLYTAWMLYGDLDEAEGDGMLFLVFTIVFVIAGVALIGLGLWNLYKENTKTAGETESAQKAVPTEDQMEKAETVAAEDLTAAEGSVSEADVSEKA